MPRGCAIVFEEGAADEYATLEFGRRLAEAAAVSGAEGVNEVDVIPTPSGAESVEVEGTE